MGWDASLLVLEVYQGFPEIQIIPKILIEVLQGISNLKL
jgi:hypothetical protein